MSGLYDEVLIALHGIWQRRWLALGAGWAIALTGWLVVSLIPNAYNSEARILIQQRAMLSNAVGTTSAERQQNIDAVRQMLTSAASIEAIVRQTDMATQIASADDMAEAVARLSRAIKVVPELDNVIRISATVSGTGLSDGANARLSKLVVEKLINLFVDGNLSDTRTETGQTLDFLNRQITQRGQDLAATETKRAQFEQKYMAMLPGGGTIADRVTAGRSEMARIDGELAAAQSAIASVRGQMASTAPNTRVAGTSAAPGAAAGILAQIADGRARGWTDQHPDMVALRDQLGRTGNAPAGRSAAAVLTQNPMYVSLRSMLAEKQAVAGALAGRKAQIQAQINAVLAEQAADPQKAAEQTEADRAYQASKAQYDKLLADREDVKLRGDVQSATAAVKFTVIEAPIVAATPASPQRPLLLTMVLLAALGGGTGTAFAAGQLKATFATAASLGKASGLPVLGSVHAVVTDAQRESSAKKAKLFNGGAAALAGVYAVLMIAEFIQRGMVA